MYLSRLILDPIHRNARRDLADCQELHRTVLAAFPQTSGDAPAREQFGVLHRIDELPRTGLLLLLVQSQVPPDWSTLPPGYLRRSAAEAENPDCKDLRPLYDAIASGDQLRFRLRANATEKTGTSLKSERLAGDRRNGRRRGLHEEELLPWLARKAEAGGFRIIVVRGTDVPAAQAARPPQTYGRRTDDHGERKRRLTFAPALFEGVLEVTDAACFRETLAHGIGPAKAYGFGLLSVARMP